MPDDTVSVYSNDHDHIFGVVANCQQNDRKQPWLEAGDEISWEKLAGAINRYRDYCNKPIHVSHLLRILGDRTTSTAAAAQSMPDEAELLMSFCAEPSYVNNRCCCHITMEELGDNNPLQQTKIVFDPSSSQLCISFDPRRVHGANFLVWIAMYRMMVHHDVCDFVVYESDLVTGMTVVDFVVSLCILRCQVGMGARVTVVQSPRSTPRKWSLRYSLRAVVRRVAERRCTGTNGVLGAIGQINEITLKEFIDRMYWMAWACRGITGQKEQYDLLNGTKLKGYTEFVRPYNKLIMPHAGAPQEEKDVYAADKKRAELLLKPYSGDH